MSKSTLGVYTRRDTGGSDPILMPTTALYERLRADDEKEQAALTPYRAWAVGIPEPKTGTLDFRRWPFQREFYSDGADEHEMGMMKGTQVGVSTYLIRWSMYWPDVRGMTGLYVFPRKAQLRDFSQGRVKPLTKGEYLSSRIPRDNIDNAMMKQIGLGLLYFRGSEVKDDLDSVDADVIAFDEYDRLVPENIEDAEHRVDASPLGLIRRVGNPTIEDWGIAGYYARSDKRHWMVKCDACGDWQDLDFWKNVDTERVLVVCAECRKPLDVRKGEWVPEVTDGKPPRGYHISRLMVPGINLAKVIANSDKTEVFSRQTFFNKDLGLPYTASEARLTAAMIAACQTIGGRFTMSVTADATDKLRTMGVDVASKRNLNVRVSEWIKDTDEKPVKKMLWVGEAVKFLTTDEGDGVSVEELMERYQVNMACVDHEPEYLAARSLANRFPGRVFIVNYSGTQADLIKFDLDMGTIGVRRTEMIDRHHAMVRDQRDRIASDLPGNYIDQMRSLVRVVEENDRGQRVAKFVKVGQQDDYGHAEVYDDIARDVWRITQSVAAATEEQYTPLDDMLDFHRSEVTDSENMDYRAGPEENLDQYREYGDGDDGSGW